MCVATLSERSFLLSCWGELGASLLCLVQPLCRTDVKGGGRVQPQTSDLASEKNKTEIPNTLHALAGEALVASAALSQWHS